MAWKQNSRGRGIAPIIPFKSITRRGQFNIVEVFGFLLEEKEPAIIIRDYYPYLPRRSQYFDTLSGFEVFTRHRSERETKNNVNIRSGWLYSNNIETNKSRFKSTLYANKSLGRT